ncbi:MAG: hypothetical protein Q605_AUC01051G0003 [Actinomyces urogenitalis DORA_12]|uniref:Uncharacterized protein n=1 Tax=Actinomyces urogenitalis DORA_12 TaxID=1403939 RepID=W1V833_9ACTO|nr:MAG: hypothetical protein Q605_AUC01051G0003 [Actinomyces urogenitalis DORA_12]
MPGQQHQRVPSLLVGGHQAPEGDVIARGVLDAVEHPQATQTHEHVHGELLAVQAHRHVVGEQRQVHGLTDGGEVLSDLGHVIDGVEGAGRHDGVSPQRLGPAGVLDDAIRCCVNGTDQHGQTAGGAVNHTRDHQLTLGVSEVGGLGGGSQEEQAVDTGVDEKVNEVVQAVQIDLAVLEGRDDRGDDTGESGIHSGVS